MQNGVTLARTIISFRTNQMPFVCKINTYVYVISSFHFFSTVADFLIQFQWTGRLKMQQTWRSAFAVYRFSIFVNERNCRFIELTGEQIKFMQKSSARMSESATVPVVLNRTISARWIKSNHSIRFRLWKIPGKCTVDCVRFGVRQRNIRIHW